MKKNAAIDASTLRRTGQTGRQLVAERRHQAVPTSMRSLRSFRYRKHGVTTQVGVISDANSRKHRHTVLLIRARLVVHAERTRSSRNTRVGQ